MKPKTRSSGNRSVTPIKPVKSPVAKPRRKIHRPVAPRQPIAVVVAADGAVVRRSPAWVVTFREPSEANAGILADALGLKEPGYSKQRNEKSRSGCVRFEAKSPEQAPAHLYERLGVATADLSPAGIERLTQNARVLAVEPNRIRSIPRPLMSCIPPDTRPPVFGVARALKDGDDKAPGCGDPVAAYLTGYRDGVDAALQAYTGMTAPAHEGIHTHAASSGAASAASATTAWHLSIVRANRAGGPTGQGIKVAVVDSGIDLAHPDFASRIIPGVNAKSFVPGQTINDLNGHGTHVAGLLAGPMHPATGSRYGVAPDVDLLIAKALDENAEGDDDAIIQGIEWADANGARIICLSIATTRDPGHACSAAYEQIAKVLLQKSPGTLIVAAAGNDSRRHFNNTRNPVCDPAACPSIMAVAAIDENEFIADFSCAKLDDIGEVNLSAPGVNVYSSWNNHAYMLDSGTSMAAPIVAGIAALLAEKSPVLDAKGLWNDLLAHARDLGAADDFGAGLARVPANSHRHH